MRQDLAQEFFGPVRLGAVEKFVGWRLLDNPAAVQHKNPVRHADPSGQIPSGEQVTVTGIQGNVVTMRTVGVNQARKSIIKRLTCVTGAQTLRAGAAALLYSGRRQQLD